MQLCKSTYVYNSLHAMKEVWEARCSALPASSMIMHLHSQNCPHLHPTIPNTRLTTPRTPYPPHDTPTSAPIQPLPQPRRTFFNSLPPAITSPTSLLTPLLSIRARFFPSLATSHLASPASLPSAQRKCSSSTHDAGHASAETGLALPCTAAISEGVKGLTKEGCGCDE